ncbi:hypothetical protein [Bradyrhizobium sp. TM233]|uniref:hypothetical protein n=1 Tax=Bradyrhizobium sp. TM233 TaxID=2599801 RepID=UPI0027D64CCF|nr:hypothetical protein TM233_41330 [Bradyrhizobium sp. TM233]
MINFIAVLILALGDLLLAATGWLVLKLFGDGEPRYGASLLMGLVFWGLVVVLAIVIQM